MNGSLAGSEVDCVAIAMGIGLCVLAKQGLKNAMITLSMKLLKIRRERTNG